MRFNTEKKNIEFCSENEWKLISSVANSCIRKRSAPFDDDFVVWCPEEHPDIYSCAQLDDQAPNTVFDLGPYCPNDGVCLMNSGPRERTDLGGDGIYYERVVKNIGDGNYVEGCSVYDEGHDHTPHRGEIMCCERAEE